MLFRLTIIFILSILPDFSYTNIINNTNLPTYPKTTLTKLDKYSLNFISYSAFYNNNFDNILKNIDNFPQWFLIMRYKGERINELWHKGEHYGYPCNVSLDEYKRTFDGHILLHLKTLGFFSSDIIFLAKYDKYNVGNFVVLEINKNKNFETDNKVLDFKMYIILSKHPTIKNLVVAIVYGYIKSSYPANMISNQVSWHLDNILQNIGER